MSRVTDPHTYKRRRVLAAGLALSAVGGFTALRYGERLTADAGQVQAYPSEVPRLSGDDKGSTTVASAGKSHRLTTKYAATHYNNAYEFGWNKADPAQRSGDFQMRPWAVTIDGLCHRPGTFDVDDLMGAPFNQLEERIYDFRCVEAWSMVIPYNGRPLRDILAAVEPMGSARYVAFTSVLRPEEMPGQASLFSSLEWPYVEALTLQEAMHPLAFATFGKFRFTDKAFDIHNFSFLFNGNQFLICFSAKNIDDTLS